MALKAECKSYELSCRGAHYGPGLVDVPSEEVKETIERKVRKLDAKYFPDQVQSTPETVEVSTSPESTPSGPTDPKETETDPSDTDEGGSAGDTGGSGEEAADGADTRRKV